jgi:hypothetical protein
VDFVPRRLRYGCKYYLIYDASYKQNELSQL